ncbi:MAG TPA: hypothetical protein VI521_01490 [Candidatus Babeliales bacterium]|nr:hypothetical protein [Candidatus Babeliales bacterium]
MKALLLAMMVLGAPSQQNNQQPDDAQEDLETASQASAKYPLSRRLSLPLTDSESEARFHKGHLRQRSLSADRLRESRRSFSGSLLQPGSVGVVELPDADKQ